MNGRDCTASGQWCKVWFVTRSTAIHDRVAGAILDAAADLLAEGGEPPSMSDVAEAAGVARATLYRYFPTRERLLQDLTAAAIDATATRLAEADLDAVPVAEGIARVARVVAAAGSKYAALVSQFGPGNADLEGQQQIKTMIDALLRRGIDDRTFRDDITAGELRFLLGSLLEAAARLAAEHQAGVEKAAALITSVFLYGTENREDPSEQDRAVRRRAGTGPEQNSNTEEARPHAPGVLPAQITRIIALTALTALGLSGAPVHEPVHAGPQAIFHDRNPA
jgi:AcrR family transcriptional regulator